MKDFHNLISRYHQFGGFKLVVEYAKLGVLGTVAKGFFRCLVKRQSFKQIYPEVLRRVEPYLIEKYAHVVSRFKFQVSGSPEHKRSKIVWFCWLQGIEQAPEIVHACYNSIKQNIPDREIKVIDNDNWKEYLELPDYLVEKWEKDGGSSLTVRNRRVATDKLPMVADWGGRDGRWDGSR